MKPLFRHVLLCFLIFSLLPGCRPKRKYLNERITLKRTDKIPYGTYVAYEELQYLFPNANIRINKNPPDYYNSSIYQHSFSSGDSINKGKALYVIITTAFYPTEKEYNAIMRFVSAGNHVFISAFSWSSVFKDSLAINTRSNPISISFSEKDSTIVFENDSLWVSVNHPVTADSLAYTYPGLSDQSYLNKYDSVYASVLGKDKKGHADLIRQTYTGGGSIYIHTDPLALTNFFLLHKKNNEYYNSVFSYLPQNIDYIEWDEYFRPGQKSFSPLQVIMNNQNLRAAFWLVLLLFLLIYLFESKRRQRIIPIVNPLRNSSLDFVKTVGRLYYQYHDNKNLGVKMTAHLFDYIRQRYNLPTSVTDERFINLLAYKSGYDKEKLNSMIYRAKMIGDFADVSDEDLMEFHKQTEAFYKHQ